MHTAFLICRLLAFTPNTMYVVVLYLQPMYVGVIFDQRRWRSKILRQDTKACVWSTHKNQEKTPEIHTAFRICRLLAFTPNTMYGVVHTTFRICRLLAFTPNTMDVCSGSVFTAYVCRGDFRSEKMAIKKYCDKIPRRAYGPLIKPSENTRDTYGVSY